MDLLHAADYGRLTVVKQLVAGDSSLIHTCRHKDAANRTFNYDASPIHYACRSGHYNVVKYLLEQSATLLHDRDVENWTPLHYACYNGHLNIVQLLLEHHADVRLRDNYLSQTPIEFAMYRQFEEIVSFLDPDAQWTRRTDGDIAKKGSTPVFRKDSKLFLGRYILTNEHVKQIAAFRADAQAADLDLKAVQDVELNDMHVRISLTHDRQRHQARTRELTSIVDDGDDGFLRSSTTSTNEHVMVFANE